MVLKGYQRRGLGAIVLGRRQTLAHPTGGRSFGRVIGAVERSEVGVESVREPMYGLHYEARGGLWTTNR